MVINVADFPTEIPLQMCGIYALVYAGRVVYIGKSVNVLARLSKHRYRYQRWIKGRRQALGDDVPVVKFDRAFVMFCPDHQLDILEYKLINKYRPECNVALVREVGMPFVDLEKLGLGEWIRKSEQSSKRFVRRV